MVSKNKMAVTISKLIKVGNYKKLLLYDKKLQDNEIYRNIFKESMLYQATMLNNVDVIDMLVEKTIRQNKSDENQILYIIGTTINNIVEANLCDKLKVIQIISNNLCHIYNFTAVKDARMIIIKAVYKYGTKEVLMLFKVKIFAKVKYYNTDCEYIKVMIDTLSERFEDDKSLINYVPLNKLLKVNEIIITSILDYVLDNLILTYEKPIIVVDNVVIKYFFNLYKDLNGKDALVSYIANYLHRIFCNYLSIVETTLRLDKLIPNIDNELHESVLASIDTLSLTNLYPSYKNYNENIQDISLYLVKSQYDLSKKMIINNISTIKFIVNLQGRRRTLGSFLNKRTNLYTNNPTLLDILESFITKDTWKIVIIMNELDEYYNEEQLSEDNIKQINTLYFDQSIKFKSIFDIYFTEKGIHKLITNYVGLYRQYL